MKYVTRFPTESDEKGIRNTMTIILDQRKPNFLLDLCYSGDLNICLKTSLHVQIPHLSSASFEITGASISFWRRCLISCTEFPIRATDAPAPSSWITL